jgi:predicted nucleotidyltransferase component of viral defense system
MISEQQIAELSKIFHIDRFSIVREYLQLVFLKNLYQDKSAGKIYFKGGTAIRLLFNSPRFSEDLDFSMDYPKRKAFDVIKKIENNIKLEIPGAKILSVYEGENSARFRLRCNISGFKFPFVIRLDFTEKQKIDNVKNSAIVTNFPIAFFPVVMHLSKEEILAEKIRALLMRAKCRDVFDTWFLLKKGIELDFQLIDKKMNEVGKKFSKKNLEKKIQTFSKKKMEMDLAQFLPPAQKRIIPNLKQDLLEMIKK